MAAVSEGQLVSEAINLAVSDLGGLVSKDSVLYFPRRNSTGIYYVRVQTAVAAEGERQNLIRLYELRINNHYRKLKAQSNG